MANDNGPTLVVLAAGMGSRFGGLKQLEPLSENGNILIEYSVFDAIRAGFGKVVFIVRRTFADDFAKLVDAASQHITIEYAFQDEYEPPGIDLPEREKPWGTGHALLAAEHLIAEPMAVINADDFYGRSAYVTAAGFLAARAAESNAYGILGYALRSVLSDHGSVSRGLCQLESDGRLSSIVEHTNVYTSGEDIVSEDEKGQKTALPDSQLASMNFWLLTPTVFPFLHMAMGEFAGGQDESSTAEFLLPDIIGNLIRSGDVTVDCLSHDDTWFGMTYPEDRASAEAVITGLHGDGTYSSPLWGEVDTDQ